MRFGTRKWVAFAAAAIAAAVLSGCPSSNRSDLRHAITLSVTSHVFPALNEGYSAGDLAPLSVTVSNTGTRPTGELSVAVTAGAADDFVLTGAPLASIEEGGEPRSFSVVPRVGLPAGNHSATVTVSGAEGINAQVALSFAVNEVQPAPEHGIEVTGVGASHAFDPLIAGYGELQLAPLSVTLSNIGTLATGALSVTVTAGGADSADFVVTGFPAAGIEAEAAPVTFAVAPRIGLGIAAHSATVTVSGENIDGASFGVSVEVVAVPPVTRAIAGPTISFAIREGGSLWAWGSNVHGRGGLGGLVFEQVSPMQVGRQGGWVHVSARNLHTLGIREVGGERLLYSWGNGADGRLGREDAQTIAVPTRVGEHADWLHASAGDDFSLGIREEGGERRLYAWGSNAGGRTGLGIGSGTQVTPTRVGDDTGWEYVSAGFNFAVGIRVEGGERRLYAWGQNFHGNLGFAPAGDQLVPARVGGETDWAAVSAGASFVLGIREVGGERRLFSWGDAQVGTDLPGGDGRLGLGALTGDVHEPTRVGDAGDWDIVSAGNEFASGIRVVGGERRLYTWGWNWEGRSGHGLSIDDHGAILVPTRIGDAADWVTVSSSSQNHSLGIRAEGPAIWGWGTNESSQLGAGGDAVAPRLVE